MKNGKVEKCCGGKISKVEIILVEITPISALYYKLHTTYLDFTSQKICSYKYNAHSIPSWIFEWFECLLDRLLLLHQRTFSVFINYNLQHRLKCRPMLLIWEWIFNCNVHINDIALFSNLPIFINAILSVRRTIWFLCVQWNLSLHYLWLIDERLF